MPSYPTIFYSSLPSLLALFPLFFSLLPSPFSLLPVKPCSVQLTLLSFFSSLPSSCILSLLPSLFLLVASQTILLHSTSLLFCFFSSILLSFSATVSLSLIPFSLSLLVPSFFLHSPLLSLPFSQLPFLLYLSPPLLPYTLLTLCP